MATKLSWLIGVMILLALAISPVLAEQKSPAAAQPQKPAVLIQAYYPLNPSHKYIKAYLEKYAKAKGPKVKLEFYDIQTDAGAKAAEKTGLACAGVFINGKNTWALTRGNKTEEISFIKRMDIFWTHQDFEAVVNSILANDGKAKPK